MSIQIIVGDCREVLKTLQDASVDSVVCDPPYELTSGKKGGSGVASVNLDSPYGRARIGTGNGQGGFMGMKWDGTGVAFDVAMWAECLRVLKPGGHLLAFGGTRTQHRMVCAIEDAGFEIRDQALWAYASGFPKSLDVSKAMDKAAGAKREVVGQRTDGRYAYEFTDAAKQALGSVVAVARDTGFSGAMGQITEPATEAAKQWQGWGTALKPAFEPICMARKPLAKGMTVAANVLAFGTGAINIDTCRIETNPGVDDPRLGGNGDWSSDKMAKNVYEGGYSGERVASSPLGRWPANLLHDGSPEVVALFPQSAGQQAFVGAKHGDRPSINAFGDYGPRPDTPPRGDSGSAARFFWCPKTSGADRHDGLQHPGPQFTSGSTLRDAENLGGKGNSHPTVKPTELMRYLCRLVTPPGGTVLDPFMGSGSTLKAAELEGFNAIGIELSEAYAAIARRRIGSDAPLFAQAFA